MIFFACQTITGWSLAFGPPKNKNQTPPMILEAIWYDYICFIGISMKILGKGNVYWSVASGETRTNYRAEEVYCDHKINLLCPGMSKDAVILFWHIIFSYFLHVIEKVICQKIVNSEQDKFLPRQMVFSGEKKASFQDFSSSEPFYTQNVLATSIKAPARI